VDACASAPTCTTATDSQCDACEPGHELVQGPADVCDACATPDCSDCAGGVDIVKAKATLTKLATAPGDDGLSFVGEMTIPTTPPIDPRANGARILLAGTGGTVADVEIPGGAFDEVTKTGWKVNKAGTAFKFTSKTGVSGITTVSVKGNAKQPGLQKLKVVGKQGAFPIAAPELPLAVTVVLEPNGQCGTTAFASCTLNASGATLKCK
jgi:hypothetical protein